MKYKGFTLIELIVTMGIIAVLTGMAVFNFNQSRMRARDVQRKSDLGQLMKALELYKIDNNHFPDTADGNFQTQLSDEEYTKVTFVDPKGSEWPTYLYINTGSDTMKYSMMACLENKADSVRANGAQCTLFGASCLCGPSSVGVMYVVSNP